MKILYHHRTLADGAEGIHIAAMLQAFTALGHDVRVLGVTPRQNPSMHQLVRHTIRHGLPRALAEAYSVLSNAPEYVVVKRHIKRFAPDLLYKRHARLDISALAAARRAGIPSVLEVNSLFTQGSYHEHEPITLRKLAVRLERRALTLATVVVAVSTPLARQAEAFASREVVVLPNGVNPVMFDPKNADPVRVRVKHHLTAALIIGWSGIIREWHGLDLLLEAAAGIPGTHLLIIGDGPGRRALERRAAARGMESRLTITGRVPHIEMPDYMAAIDVAVVADDRTGVASPMKLREYMAMARPVVAPALDNIRDLLADGTEGLLFTAGDSDALRRALNRLACDRPLRETLGRNARLRVERDGDWRRNAERVISLIRDCGAANAGFRP